MTTPFETVREALEAAQNGLKWYRDAHPGDASQADDEMDAEIEEALTALSELERLAGEQEPVAWYLPAEGGDDSMFRDAHTIAACTGNKWEGWTPLYTATPPANQGDVVVSWDEQQTRILAVTVQDEDGRILKVIAEAPAQQPIAWVWNPATEMWERVRAFGHWQQGALYAFGPEAPTPAQQPQYEAGDMASAHNDGFRAGVASVAKQPQAEAVPVGVLHRGEGGAFRFGHGYHLLGLYALPPGEHDLYTAPQQAEAVPSDVVRDAERYRFLTDDHSDYDTRTRIDQIAARLSIRGKGATDAMVDSAMAQGEKP